MSDQSEVRKTPHLVSEGVWIVVGKVSSFVAMLAMVRLLTGQLDTTEYGKLALGLTVCNLITQLIMGALGQGIGRYYSMALHEGGYTIFFRAAKRLLKYSGGLIGSLCVACGLIAVFLSQYDYALFAIILLVFSYLAGLNDIANGLHNLARNRMISVRNATLELIIRLPIVAGILLVFGKTAEMVIAGYLISGLILAFVQRFDLDKLKPAFKYSAHIAEDWQSQILKIALPASIWGVFVWMQQASDRWLLQTFTTTHDVAQYAVIYQVGYTPIIIGMGVLTTLFTPIFYQQKKSNRNLINQLLVFVLGITCLGVAVSSVLAELIMSSLASAKYQEAANYLPHMVLAAGLYSAGDTLSIKMMSDIRIKAILSIKVLASLLGILANTIGAYHYGIKGVVHAAIFFGFIYLLLFAAAYLRSILHEKVSNV